MVGLIVIVLVVVGLNSEAMRGLGNPMPCLILVVVIGDRTGDLVLVVGVYSCPVVMLCGLYS